jgi:hypothetical protein
VTYQQYVDGNHTDAEKIAYRNRIIYEIANVIDENYAGYKSELYTRRGTKDFLSDIGVLGLTSAAGVTGGAELKSILSVNRDRPDRSE